jgi:hypothetical protein
MHTNSEGGAAKISEVQAAATSYVRLLLRVLLCRYMPLAGITSQMLVWLFNNDHSNVTFTGADGQKRNMPM